MPITLRKLYTRISGSSANASKHCAMCAANVQAFHPYQGGWSAAPQLLRLLRVVGSDLDNWSCPSCGAHDRERHLLLYLERTGLLERFRGARVLHFAPERRLVRRLLALGAAEYVQADLFPTGPEIRAVDMLNIDFADHSFDIVIANHVLEHVLDDGKALSELYRVASPGGFAILQTPYSSRLSSTLEDPGIDDDEARTEIYGQRDHVRLYGRDIFQRFAAVGFVADVRLHDQVLADINPVEAGVNPAEPLFLFHRI